MSVTPGMFIKVASEFSETPGPRSREEGEFSGAEFLENILAPKFEQARQAGTTLTVDLDGTEGYATSFLEAAFGGLARKYSEKAVQETVILKSEDEPYLVDEIGRYIAEANRV
jgi:hypothetical protein